MKVLLGILFTFILAVNAQAKDIYPAVCESGIDYSKDKQFAVYIFCEPDALGTSIGVIATGDAVEGAEVNSANWNTAKRFWQDSVWATDVNSYSWSDDEKYLLVATGDVYGTGKKYRLDLLNKVAEEIRSLGK